MEFKCVIRPEDSLFLDFYDSKGVDISVSSKNAFCFVTISLNDAKKLANEINRIIDVQNQNKK